VRDISDPLILKSEWLLDPNVTFLNHGSFGAVPRGVLAEQRRLQERMERNPGKFLAVELSSALRAAAARLAQFLGGQGSDYVFAENVTAAVNTILQSVRFGPGDEILLTDHGYPAILKAAQHIAARTGARVVQAQVPFPAPSDADIIAAIETRLGSRTRLAILDHVTSPTALVFPVKRLTELCHSAGALVLIDGAHAPGMLSLDIPAVGADWYVGNCHKWLMAPRGAAFIWASAQRQAEIHPLVISHGLDQGFNAEFDWVGTRDPTAWLTVPAAIDWHNRAGGPKLRDRNASLIEAAATALASSWNTEIGSRDCNHAAMKTIRLPLHGDATEQFALNIRASLRMDHRIDVVVVAFTGHLWARISAQAYNSLPDYDRLAHAVALISGIRKSQG
jgi:isopenicillin-N epimerase